MSTTTPSTKERILPEVAFGVAVMRGIGALAIGVLLLFIPDKSTNILVNMMGLFWLLTGIALLRRSPDDPAVMMLGNRSTRIIGVVGAVAGLLVVTRSLTRQVVPEATFFVLLGVIILLTGLVHLTADVRFGNTVNRGHRWLGVLLALFEIVLGLTLIISPLDRSPVTYWIATIWALVFGVMVIGDAILKRAQTRKTIEGKPSESGKAAS